MFLHNNAIFRKYSPTLKPFIITWITSVNFITPLNSAVKPSFHINQMCGISIYVIVKKFKYTYLLTPWCRVLLEKLIGLQLVKKFLSFH